MITEASLDRGLVMSVPWGVSPEGKVIFKTSNLDPQEVRYGILFWDKLAWANGAVINFAGGADEQFLEQAGILIRPRFRTRWESNESHAEAQVAVFQKFEAEEPGRWSLGQALEDILIRRGALKPNKEAACIELYRAIPVPDKEVPLEAVLDFKRRRLDELQALRSQIDSMVALVNNSADGQQSLNVRSSRLIRLAPMPWPFFASGDFPFM